MESLAIEPIPTSSSKPKGKTGRKGVWVAVQKQQARKLAKEEVVEQLNKVIKNVRVSYRESPEVVQAAEAAIANPPNTAIQAEWGYEQENVDQSTDDADEGKLSLPNFNRPSQPQEHSVVSTLAAESPVAPVPQTPRKRRTPNSKQAGMLAGGTALFSAAVIAVGPGLMPDSKTVGTFCQEKRPNPTELSREKVVKTAAIKERSPQQAVEALLGTPYCNLANIEVRRGLTANRVAYALEYDGTKWLILMYEKGEFVGAAIANR